MNVLLATPFWGSLSELERTWELQHQADPTWSSVTRLYVGNLPEDLPDKTPQGASLLWRPLDPDDPPLANKLRNGLLAAATDLKPDLLIILDADIVLSGPLEEPATGFANIPRALGAEGQLPPWPNPEWSWSSTCILTPAIYKHFRYEESFVGYGYEDVDFQWTVLWFAGVWESYTPIRAWHLYHPPRAWRDQKQSDISRQKWFDRMREAHLTTGRPYPYFPPHERPDWWQEEERSITPADICAVLRVPDGSAAVADIPYLAYGVYPLELSVLYGLVQGYRPQRILEVGTHFGVSTKAFARALLKNGSGRITTIDAEAWPQNFLTEAEKSVVDYVISDARTCDWPDDATILFEDGPHTPGFTEAILRRFAALPSQRTRYVLVHDTEAVPCTLQEARMVAQEEGWEEQGVWVFDAPGQPTPRSCGLGLWCIPSP